VAGSIYSEPGVGVSVCDDSHAGRCPDKSQGAASTLKSKGRAGSNLLPGWVKRDLVEFTKAMVEVLVDIGRSDGTHLVKTCTLPL
jgi:hypothetical protein